jgi:hypothetical protein
VPVYPSWSGVSLIVQIVRFEADDNPGWVACEFEDADGSRHTLIDKVPIFTIEMLDANSAYPQPGLVRCEVLNRLQDRGGKELIRVTTASPDGVESTQGLKEFVVLPPQLSMEKGESTT